MAQFLRSRLICFYCNRRSSQKRESGLKKFKCEHCDAENYLDKNGEITDPPINSSSNSRYALSVERPSSVIFDTAPSQIFCNTCLQNQQIYAQSLAEYYPTPSLSTFQEYEQAEAEYKASLEQRYPLICEDCEPLARKRLKDSSYAVKIDNMRRVMERTHPDLRHLNEAAPWKLWIPFVGGWMWALSWAGQAVWDLNGILTTQVDFRGVEPLLQHTFWEDLRQYVLDRQMSPNAIHLNVLMAKYALFLGVFSVWWNPRLEEKIRRKSGRMVDTGDYYSQQVVFLAMRGAALYLMPASLQAEQEQAAHLFLLLASVLAIIKSYRTVQMDFTPKASWRESPKSLLSQAPRQPSSTQDTPTANRRNRRETRPEPFPIESLASKPLTPFPHAESDPTPDYTQASFLPSDDRMDWAPTLPAPRNYKALNPPAPFKSSTIPTAGGVIDPSPNLSIFSNLSPIPRTSQQNHQELSNPKLFFPPTTETDTGLESIFDRAFSISHPPAEVRDLHAAETLQRQRAAETETRRAPLRFAIYWRIIMLLLLGAAYSLLFLSPESDTGIIEDDQVVLPWSQGWRRLNITNILLLLQRLQQLQHQQKSILAFGIAAFATLTGVGIAPTRERGWIITLLVGSVEIAAVAIFGAAAFSGRDGFGNNNEEEGVVAARVRGQMALGVIAVMELMVLGRLCVRRAAVVV